MAEASHLHQTVVKDISFDAVNLEQIDKPRVDLWSEMPPKTSASPISDEIEPSTTEPNQESLENHIVKEAYGTECTEPDVILERGSTHASSESSMNSDSGGKCIKMKL